MLIRARARACRQSMRTIKRERELCLYLYSPSSLANRDCLYACIHLHSSSRRRGMCKHSNTHARSGVRRARPLAIRQRYYRFLTVRGAAGCLRATISGKGRDSARANQALIHYRYYYCAQKSAWCEERSEREGGVLLYSGRSAEDGGRAARGSN